MATTQAETLLSLERGASLVGDYGEVVKLNTSGQVVLVAAVTDYPIGVVAEGSDTTPSGVGRRVPVAGDAVAVASFGHGGVLKMKAGAAVTAGQFVILHTTDGTVMGVTTLGASHDKYHVIGVALEAAAVGAIFRVLVQPFQYTD